MKICRYIRIIHLMIFYRRTWALIIDYPLMSRNEFVLSDNFAILYHLALSDRALRFREKLEQIKTYSSDEKNRVFFTSTGILFPEFQS